MDEKVIVVFKATGDAPILKNSKVKVPRAHASRALASFRLA